MLTSLVVREEGLIYAESSQWKMENLDQNSDNQLVSYIQINIKFYLNSENNFKIVGPAERYTVLDLSLNPINLYLYICTSTVDTCKPNNS